MRDYKASKPSRRALPKKLREQVKAKFGGRCGYCGATPERMQIDHMIPIERGGSNDEPNLMPACLPCNNLKSVFDVEEFRVQIQSQLGRAWMYSVNYRTALRFNQVIENRSPIKFYFETVSLTHDNER